MYHIRYKVHTATGIGTMADTKYILSSPWNHDRCKEHIATALGAITDTKYIFPLPFPFRTYNISIYKSLIPTRTT